MERKVSDINIQINEEIEHLQNLIRKILTFLNIYNNKINIPYFYLDMENELLKLNLKYLDTILNHYSDRKNKNLLKLYDFTIHEFKRLRSKYEEMEINYFSLDEESKYIFNIKQFMEKEKFIQIGKMGYLYLRLCLYNLNSIYGYLEKFRDLQNKLTNEDIENYQLIVKLNNFRIVSNSIFVKLSVSILLWMRLAFRI
jgi:hypothetical protein